MARLLYAVVQLSSILLTTTRAFQIPSTFGTARRTALTVKSADAIDETLTKDENSDIWDLSLFSPAKINIFLRIIRKREDGFHDLASLFQTIGFGDYLHLKLLDDDEEAKEDILTCNMEGVPTDKSNLVMRAIDLVRQNTGITDKFFKCDLVKHVPHQAGLGGGSGNAAAALYGANELLGRPATLEQLVEWSGDLGSDITFFLSEGTAYCTGRGEIMTPVDPLPAGQTVYIVKPDIGLSTPSVFKALDYDLLSTLDPEEILNVFMTEGVTTSNQSVFVNDLEPPAFKVVPELKELKDDLISCGFDTVMMSGSGTSIFCLGEPGDGQKFEELIGRRDDVQVYPTEFINRVGCAADGGWYQDPNAAKSDD
eukprot:CAMPEP_0196810060 /NCGR_PEP_ID=MMETSP1362-20130617/9902_1 /TAXON_ID=163516 /ORGANISM="Leptocylindrus danicus, Strain CCMP1856" /LENGTH=367 /DNA_ID=CAMNT_0042184923 /DNA_START=36 /DNA_END=1139 /DNA_ORIENTATION=+